MARTLMEQLARHAGYCCTFNLLKHNRKLSLAKLGDRLGLAKSTIAHYRKQYAAGKVMPCFKCPKTILEERPLAPLRRSSKAGK